MNGAFRAVGPSSIRPLPGRQSERPYIVLPVRCFLVSFYGLWRVCGASEHFLSHKQSSNCWNMTHWGLPSQDSPSNLINTCIFFSFFLYQNETIFANNRFFHLIHISLCQYKTKKTYLLLLSNRGVVAHCAAAYNFFVIFLLMDI